MARVDRIHQAWTEHDEQAAHAEWDWWKTCGWEYVQARRDAEREAAERRAAARRRVRDRVFGVVGFVAAVTCWLGPVGITVVRSL